MEALTLSLLLLAAVLVSSLLDQIIPRVSLPLIQIALGLIIAIVAGGVAEQATQCLKNIEAIVNSIDHDLNDVIRLSIYLRDIMDLNAVEKVQAEFFPTYQPARTVVAVEGLPQDALVMVEALVDNGEGTQSVPQAGDLLKLTNNTHNAPYDACSTQTVAFSHYNNITMQLPLCPKSGRPILGDVAAQTAQCLRNVKAILESVDVPLDDIVKVTIFVKDLADVEAVNGVYKTFFPDSGIARAVNYLPARTMVPVKDLPYHCASTWPWKRSCPMATAPRPRPSRTVTASSSRRTTPTPPRSAPWRPRPWPSPTTTTSPPSCPSTSTAT